MSAEKRPNSIDQQLELPGVKTPVKLPVPHPKGMTPQDRDLEAKQAEAEKRNQAKIVEIRKSLGLETTEEKGILIASSGEETTDYDEVLGKFVLGDNPDKIVDQIFSQVPNSLTMADNYLGEIKRSIRIWVTESAANAARHISYRQTGDNSVKYRIKIFCRIKMMHGGRYLEISMQDNGIGIKPENLAKIGQERFTTFNEQKGPTGLLHGGGHGRFSADYKNEIAHPREWEMSIKNRDAEEQGAISFLTIPLRDIEGYEADRLAA